MIWKIDCNMNEGADCYKRIDVIDGQADMYDHIRSLYLYCQCSVSFVGFLYEVTNNVLCRELFLLSVRLSVRPSVRPTVCPIVT